MRSLLSGICILYIFSSFTPGVGHSKLTGRSSSGRTIFTAEFENYSTLEKGELTVDKEQMIFMSSDRCHVIFDDENKVYTLHIESEAYSNFDTLRYIELWAIPSTFTVATNAGTEFSEVYKFKAKMKARDPRKGKDYEMPIIKLDCTLGYTNP